MNIDKLTIGEARQLVAMFTNTNIPNTSVPHGAVGKKCIVRTYASGVHFGEVMNVQENGGRSRCELRNSRRIWYWSGAFTLSAVAMHGFTEAKLSCVVPVQYIEDAVEFIPASDKAATIINKAKTYEP